MAADDPLPGGKTIPNCPPFTDSDDFIETVAEQDASPYLVRKQTVQAGQANDEEQVAPEGSEVHVHYEVYDNTGRLHDSSKQRDFPYHFTLGESHAAPLWAAAIRSMIRGEKAIFHCEVNHIYKPFKKPPTIKDICQKLNVHVEYLYWDEWANVVYDGRIKKKKMVKTSNDIATPNDGSHVTVRYTGKLLDGTVFEPEVERSFVICKEDIIEGLELAIKSMSRGEHSLFRIDPSYAWGSAGDRDLNIPPNTTIEYLVELLDYSEGTLKWELTAEQKLEFAISRKVCGNKAYRLGQLERAARLYKHAVELIQYEGETNIPEQAKQTKTDALNNLSVIMLKQKEYGEAITYATKVLNLNPTNVKALYRRAQCYIATAQPDLATIDIEAGLALDSESAILKSMLLRCKQAIAKANRKTVNHAAFWKIWIDVDCMPGCSVWWLVSETEA